MGRTSPPEKRTVRMFQGRVRGLAIQLPGWRYPLVADLARGVVHYDNYGGRWGAARHLDAFRQAYTVERARLEAQRQGHSVREQPLADGSIKLTIQLGDVS